MEGVWLIWLLVPSVCWGVTFDKDYIDATTVEEDRGRSQLLSPCSCRVGLGGGGLCLCLSVCLSICLEVWVDDYVGGGVCSMRQSERLIQFRLSRVEHRSVELTYLLHLAK